MYQVLQVYPDEEWLTRLRRGNIVYLVKEKNFADVEWPYEPPGPQSLCGRVGLKFFHLLPDGRRDYSCRRQDSWYIRANGQGIDGSQCLLPVEGHVPDNPLPLPPEDIRYILRRLARLEEILIKGVTPAPLVIIDVPVVEEKVVETNVTLVGKNKTN